MTGRRRPILSSGLVAIVAAAMLTLVPATAAQADVTVTSPAALQAELAATDAHGNSWDEGAGIALPIALVTILGGASLILLRRRRAV